MGFFTVAAFTHYILIGKHLTTLHVRHIYMKIAVSFSVFSKDCAWRFRKDLHVHLCLQMRQRYASSSLTPRLMASAATAMGSLRAARAAWTRWWQLPWNSPLLRESRSTWWGVSRLSISSGIGSVSISHITGGQYVPLCNANLLPQVLDNTCSD